MTYVGKEETSGIVNTTSSPTDEASPVHKENSFGAADDLLDQFEDLKLDEACDDNETVYIDVHTDLVEDKALNLVKVEITEGYPYLSHPPPIGAESLKPI